MSNIKAAQYPYISQPHRIHLSKRERNDLAGPIDHRPIRRGLLALILREQGHAPADALRMALEEYPE